nr:hypothetical protein [Tanacetum cinerariifolium]
METSDEELSKLSQTLEANQAEKNSLSIKGSKLAEEIKINHEKIQEIAAECIEKTKLEENVQSSLDKGNENQEEILSLCSQKVVLESQLVKSSQESSGYLIQIDSLKQELEAEIAEEQKLIEEREVYVARVKDLEEEVKSLQKRLKEEVEKLTNVQENTVEGKEEDLETKSKEQEKTVEEKNGYESKVKDIEFQLRSLDNLKSESEIQLEKNEKLKLKSKDQAKTIEEKEAYELKVKNLELLLESINHLKIELEGQLEKKGTEISEILTLNQSLNETIKIMSKDQTKTLEEKEGYEFMVKKLELKHESLEKLKNELELQLEKKGTEISELLIQNQSLKDELETKLNDQAKTLEEKESCLRCVSDIRVVTPRALVYVGFMTSGDARSWYMINKDAKSWVCVIMLPRIKIRSAGRGSATPRGGGIGGRVGRGGGRGRGPTRGSMQAKEDQVKPKISCEAKNKDKEGLEVVF